MVRSLLIPSGVLPCVSTAFPLDFPTGATGWTLFSRLNDASGSFRPLRGCPGHDSRFPVHLRVAGCIARLSSLGAPISRLSLNRPMPMRLKCCGGRMRSRHDGNSACFSVGRSPGTAALSALHLAASKRVAHHSPQRSAPCCAPRALPRQGADGCAGYASNSPLINWIRAGAASGHNLAAARFC